MNHDEMYVEEREGPDGTYFIVTDGAWAWSTIFSDRTKAQAFADDRNNVAEQLRRKMFFTGKVDRIDRLPSTHAGNPRFDLAIIPTDEHGYPTSNTAILYRVKPNSTISYEITPGWLGKRFTFRVDGINRIIDAKEA